MEMKSLKLKPMIVCRVASMAASAILLLFLTTMAQDEVVYLAPGDSVPMSQLLGSEDSSLSLQLPAFGQWSLSPLQAINEISGTMTVTTPEQEDQWSITVPAGIKNDGILAEYDIDAGSYIAGGKKLDSSLQIEAEGGNIVDLAKGGLLISGEGPAQIDIKLKQAVSYHNSPLIEGHVYRTPLSFIISSGLP